MKNKILLEACVDSFESAMAAQKGGVDRIELCSALPEGGITPSSGLTDVVCRHLSIPVMVIVRPRAGDFLYSDHEFEVMKKEIELLKLMNVKGFVFGILKADGTVDRKRTKELIELARPLEITFHRAFDMTRDPLEALGDLIELSADRILTSGHKSTAINGIELISKLNGKAGNKISIMPGGGINESNAAEIVSRCGVKEIHASARVKKKSMMQYQNTKTFLGGDQNISEYEITVTSEERIRAIIKAVNPDS